MKVPIFAATIALAASSAAAQTPRGYVQGMSGITFMAETAGAFGVEGGLHLSPNLVVFGQAGRFLNVLPDSVRRDIDRAAASAEDFLGRRLQLDARIRATYAGGGIKYLLPLGGQARPYVLGSVGVVTYEGSLREVELGDILAIAIALGAVDAEDVEGTEAAYEVGGGVVVGRRRVQFDVGYRLMNVSGVNISRIVAGVGARF